MEEIFVSVVMSSYNHAEYVGKAIESVLRQTYKNFEMIIVDDISNGIVILPAKNENRLLASASPFTVRTAGLLVPSTDEK